MDFAADASRLLGKLRALEVRTDTAERKILDAALARDKDVRARMEQLRPVVLTQPGAAREYQVLTLELRRLALVIEMARKNLAHASPELMAKGGGNPYHDPKTGQFTEAPSGGSGQSGDQEWLVNPVDPLRQVRNYDEAEKEAQAFVWEPLKNEATGLEARVSSRDLKKMIRDKNASDKSESPAIHAMAAANADILFKRAILGWSKPDRNNDANIRAVHRFFAPFKVDGRVKMVKLTVKEYVLPVVGNSLYTVEAVEVNENKPGRQWVEASALSDGISLKNRNPPQLGIDTLKDQDDPRGILTRPHGSRPDRSAEDVLILAKQIEDFNRSINRSAALRKAAPPWSL